LAGDVQTYQQTASPLATAESAKSFNFNDIDFSKAFVIHR